MFMFRTWDTVALCRRSLATELLVDRLAGFVVAAPNVSKRRVLTENLLLRCICCGVKDGADPRANCHNHDEQRSVDDRGKARNIRGTASLYQQQPVRFRRSNFTRAKSVLCLFVGFENCIHTYSAAAARRGRALVDW